jgi:tetratricopeptide (TPR) repeat protein
MKKIKLIIYVLAFIPFLSCQDYLDEAPKGNIIPKSVDDLGGMMDDFFGGLGNNVSAGINYSILLDDDARIYPSDQAALSLARRKLHTWSDEIYTASQSDEAWDNIYHSIYTCNWVLENINDVEDSPENDYEREVVEAWAYTHRAFNYLLLVNDYAPFYNAGTASTDLAIPMPLVADINEQLPKSTVAEVYEQILSDVNNALPYLKDQEVYPFRASKLNAYALLARAHMFRQEYDEMLDYAEKALAINETLLDFNTLSPTFLNDFGVNGWDARLGYNFQAPGILLYKTSPTEIYQLSDELLSLFDVNNDLRYRYFTSNINLETFSPGAEIRTTYLYDHSLSLTMGELYIMAAEASLRSDNGTAEKARNYLNTLRENRIENVLDITETDEVLLLKHILNERRIETRMKGLRWYDLKRLKITTPIVHEILGETFTYDPVKDGEYYLPIPTNVLQANPLLNN